MPPIVQSIGGAAYLIDEWMAHGISRNVRKIPISKGLQFLVIPGIIEKILGELAGTAIMKHIEPVPFQFELIKVDFRHKRVEKVGDSATDGIEFKFPQPRGLGNHFVHRIIRIGYGTEVG